MAHRTKNQKNKSVISNLKIPLENSDSKICEYCGKQFAQLYHKKYHISSVHEKNRYKCTKCERSYTGMY